MSDAEPHLRAGGCAPRPSADEAAQPLPVCVCLTRHVGFHQNAQRNQIADDVVNVEQNQVA
jgi:hypothetical protein